MNNINISNVFIDAEIDRDLNGCLNIRKIFINYLDNGERPLKYCRNYNLKKDANHLVENNSLLNLSNSVIPH